MKTVRFALAIAGALAVQQAQAISLDDIQLWTGSGTNRAALVIEWSAPEVLTNSSVPVPIADKTLVWGFRFNGTATGTQMIANIAGSDPKLYFVADDTSGSTFIEGIGYNLSGNDVIGITDGSQTDLFNNGYLIDPTVDADSAQAVNAGDLYWGGVSGPRWEIWNEAGDAGGFFSSPNRGPNLYWTPTDQGHFSAGAHGQWEYAQAGLDELSLTNGSWIAFSVAAGADDTLHSGDPSTTAFNLHKHAPPSPDGTYVAYICNTNDFAVQVLSTNDIDPGSPYNNPAAVLNRPTLQFYDAFDGGVTDRVSIIDDPYNVTPGGGDVIAEIKSGGQITVQLGRKVYADPNNPYGIDLIIYGNSFFDSPSGGSGSISDSTDLSAETLKSSAIYGHPTVVSVSQDGVNWFAFPAVSCLFPDNAYRWDDTNSSWTDEEMNPTKPLNPFVYTNAVAGWTVSSVLDQFIGASGGTGYSLNASGLPWIQYVRIQPGAGTYTVIDAIAAVSPAVVGDALSIAPDNLASGITNLVFQNPAALGQNQISINFGSVNEIARISTVSLGECSSFAPVAGNVCGAYQIQARPMTGTNPVIFTANLALSAGASYSGNGSDLRVCQWNCTNWTLLPFVFNPAGNQVILTGVTNFSAFVISQIVPPRLSIQMLTNGFAIQFISVPNCLETLERSTNLVNWTPVGGSFSVGAAVSTVDQDFRAPAGKAFYRVTVSVP